MITIGGLAGILPRKTFSTALCTDWNASQYPRTAIVFRCSRSFSLLSGSMSLCEAAQRKAEYEQRLAGYQAEQQRKEEERKAEFDRRQKEHEVEQDQRLRMEKALFSKTRNEITHQCVLAAHRDETNLVLVVAGISTKNAACSLNTETGPKGPASLPALPRSRGDSSTIL